jgi:hypothetical protein
MLHKTRLGLAATLASLGLIATTSSASSASLPAWGTAPVTRSNPTTSQPRVVDLRFDEHARFDRVVIDVRGHRPGLTARYVRRLVFDASGKPVKLQGSKKFSLVLSPARAHDNQGENLYDGPRLRRLHLSTLRGVAFTGDYEGYVSFGFTTERRAPYRIFRLTLPTRVVLDFRH